jgi:sec-independent protein translocase protein TatB
MDVSMFGLGFGEIVIIAILALLLLGPDRLPDAAKALGKGLREIKKATDDLKDQVEKEINLKEILEEKPKPALVPPVPARPIPGPSGPPPAATAENVPGLEAALADPVTVAEELSPPPGPATAPEPAPPPDPAPAAEPPAASESSQPQTPPSTPPSTQNP